MEQPSFPAWSGVCFVQGWEFHPQCACGARVVELNAEVLHMSHASVTTSAPKQRSKGEP